MNRRTFAAGLLLLFTVPAFPRQSGDATPVTDAAGIPTVEAQRKLFTTHLDLTGDQQAKLQPVLQDLRNATVAAVNDESMSLQERTDHIHAARLTADRRIREFLTDEQRAKLDQLERQPHPELHGNLP